MWKQEDEQQRTKKKLKLRTNTFKKFILKKKFFPLIKIISSNVSLGETPVLKIMAKILSVYCVLCFLTSFHRGYTRLKLTVV